MLNYFDHLLLQRRSSQPISWHSTAVHNTAQNSSDNLLSYHPDSHHCSDTVYWRGEEAIGSTSVNVKPTQLIDNSRETDTLFSVL